MKASCHSFFDDPAGLWQYSLKSHFNPKVYLKRLPSPTLNHQFSSNERSDMGKLRHYDASMMELSNAEVRKFKATAQRMKAMLKIGRAGLSPEFLKTVDETLKSHELIKVKFEDFKEKRKLLAPELAEKTSSHLVTLVGNVAVLYRKKTKEETP